MGRDAVSTGMKVHRHVVAAAVLALLAWRSLAKFPGLSGQLGAIGLLVLASIVYCVPSLSATPLVLPRRGRFLIHLTIAAGLSLTVASVVVWSMAR